MHLDHLPSGSFADRLPGISEATRIFAGADVAKGPAPAWPTRHYNMVGTPTNSKTQVVHDETNVIVPGLLAAGA